MIQDAIKKGLGFGISSAIITTLGIIVGIHSGTDLKHAVIAAILIIAFADSMADSLGVYFSEKSRADSTQKECIVAMISAFLSKILFALSFLIPIIIFSDLHVGIAIDLIYGAILLIAVTYGMAREKKENMLKMISFHVILAIIVITISHFIGLWINSKFGS